MATKIRKTSNGGIPVVATVQNSRSAGATSLVVDTQQFWPSGSTIDFSTYKIDPSNSSKRLAGSQTDWTGTSDGTNTLSGLVVVGGAADAGNAIGDKVQMGPTGDWAEQLVEGILNQHISDGTHGAVTATSLSTTGAITAAGTINGSAGLNISAGSVSVPAGSIQFAALLSTIFSGQVQTQANVGTAGGTIYSVNLGGIKLCWGTTANNASNAGGINYTVVFPTGFFTTIQAAGAWVISQGTSGNQGSPIDGVTALGLNLKVNSGSSTTGTQVTSFFAIGA